ncbi:hypothetical protein GCM10010109_33840 [Actinoplanes campanulatus]|nr:hypothetical protein GCM10010109_33840 [Actinoplanes campanulatus]GID35765.1 hypothetical protein Aca09nite_22710 [Actinoplanes campanulatus]
MGLAACGEEEKASSAAPAVTTPAATTTSAAAPAGASEKEICTAAEKASLAYGEGLIALAAKATNGGADLPLAESKGVLKSLAASLTEAAGSGDTATAKAVTALAAAAGSAAKDKADPIGEYDNNAKATAARTAVNKACEALGVDTAL